MAWWVIIDGILDAFDSLNQQKPEESDDDLNGSEADPLASLFAFIAGGITLLTIGVYKLYKFFTEHKETLQGNQYTMYSGSDIMSTAVGGVAVITSKYGSPREYRHGIHEGVDLRASYGSPIYAPITGTVVRVHNSTEGAGGRYVSIKSTDGSILVEMMHLSSISVTEGQSVHKGQFIGKSGQSGQGMEHRFAPHLHLQVKIKEGDNYVSVDPEKLYSVNQLGKVEDAADTAKIMRVSDSAGAGAGLKAKNPGNYTGNEFASGRYRQFARFNTWEEGYAAMYYQLLIYCSGKSIHIKQRNPTFAQVCRTWAEACRRDASEISKRASLAGVKDINSRIPIKKETILRIGMALGFCDSHHCVESQARRGLEMAWNRWLSRGGVPDEGKGNILNSKGSYSHKESSVTVVNNSANRRQ